ncbi:uncharacterized protein LOC128994652 [Macrosteles quadrilineatus]|uniref:uncharacterized protein LOC128994652 n=1 Tax=Macrosteles quadrilineatus TaxID=74068 RepID=UPI0023E23C46|nr:uncharacterized protein LOC128994652 [Macrosteles quadrilineatus]
MKILIVQLLITMTICCEAFYQPFKHGKMKRIEPNTLEELKTALCTKDKDGKCDDEPRKIIIKKIFDFTDSEGYKTELGCFHLSEPLKCKVYGQLKLNINEQCNGLEPTDVTYSIAGRVGLDVGSNKIIEGSKKGGLMGKGLMMMNVKNVEIRKLRITDINPRVIWGGDAIDIRNSQNILIDGCYIKNIGRQMMVTHFGSSTGILVRNTVFDGNTPFSPYCNGRHYWLWLFLGEADQIAMQNNVIFHTNGRGPHLHAKKKSILHLIQNIFYDIKSPGLLIEQDDPETSILAEGNIFYGVEYVVRQCSGHIFFPKTAKEAEQCKAVLGRECLVNKVEDSKNADPTNDLVVLEDFRKIKSSMVCPIKMKNSITKQIKIPKVVKKLIE